MDELIKPGVHKVAECLQRGSPCYEPRSALAPLARLALLGPGPRPPAPAHVRLGPLHPLPPARHRRLARLPETTSHLDFCYAEGLSNHLKKTETVSGGATDFFKHIFNVLLVLLLNFNVQQVFLQIMNLGWNSPGVQGALKACPRTTCHPKYCNCY